MAHEGIGYEGAARIPTGDLTSRHARSSTGKLPMTDDDTPTVSTLVTGVVPFEVVLERHGQGVLRLCVARLGPDRGEEAFQETLIAALRHYGELHDPAAVGGWLFSIARHKIIDIARSRQNTAIPSDELEEQAAPWQDPDATTGGLWPHVAALPAKQREAVTLRHLADLSHADIARAMGTTAEAARRNVFEGLKRLRKELPDDRNDL
jgi:RNA polymerase sigma factor (sigma-70 family)